MTDANMCLAKRSRKQTFNSTNSCTIIYLDHITDPAQAATVSAWETMLLPLALKPLLPGAARTSDAPLW